MSATILVLVRQSMALMQGQGRSIAFDANRRPMLLATAEVERNTVNDLAARADWVLWGLERGLCFPCTRGSKGLPTRHKLQKAGL